MSEAARKTLEKAGLETNKTLNVKTLNGMDESQNFEKGDITYALD
jgi:hypothetical protein